MSKQQKKVKNDLVGRVMLVTGGAKGIGSGCARLFVEEGWNVVVLDIDDRAGHQLAAELDANTLGACKFFRCDVGDFDELQAVFNQMINDYGRLDCLINNAVQFPPRKKIEDYSAEEICSAININLSSYIFLCKLAVPYLRETRGSVVNMSSIVAIMGQDRNSVYGAAKGGISALTKALAIDEAPYGVRVNAVAPGNILTGPRLAFEASLDDPQGYHDFIETWQWLGRSGSIEEVAQTCHFLASEDASFITGVELPFTGGIELGQGPKTEVLRYY